jgi:very-short-patch-repair endonuclease
MTDAERKLWGALRNRRLDGHKFARQVPISRYIADFACREHNLIIELDGGQHSGSVTDDPRTRVLQQHGFAVLRFWNNDVLGNLDGVLDVISEHLKKPPAVARHQRVPADG